MNIETILVALAVVALLVAACLRGMEWALLTTSGIAVFGFMLGFAVYVLAHYVPTPVGAGALVKFDDPEADWKLMVLVLNIITWYCFPLMGFGVHDFCRGWVDIWQVSLTHNALVCRACHLRVVVPRGGVATYGELRAFFQKFQPALAGAT